MIQRDYLIIGSGIGGARACEGVRKHDKRGTITIVGAEIMPPYNRWMLSKDFLREKTAPLKKLAHFDQRWFDSHKIETRFATIVKQFNIERRLAVLGNGESVEFNKACLAMGSRPVRPPVAGVNLGNVIYLRTVRDAFALREMANVEKTVLVVVACGAEPNLDLVRNTPLSGPHGSPVTEYLETEEKGIFAVGDLAFYPDRIMGGVRRQTHWENARAQGLVAGANMTGKKRIRYEQIPYFWTEMFDLRLHFVGDFSLQPTRVDLRGTYAKKKFLARYYQGEKLRAILLCNQTEREVESAKKELRQALGK